MYGRERDDQDFYILKLNILGLGITVLRERQRIY
jgi:hypothetical protein